MATVKQTRLSDYIEKVAAGKPINYDAFEKLLDDAGFSERQRRSLFRVVMLGRGRYEVEILDREMFRDLQIRFGQQQLTDRFSAAAAGNSHRIGVSGACLLLRSSAVPHPQVVLFEGEQWTCPVEPAGQALLVENLENFLALEQTLAFTAGCGWVTHEPIDLLFAAGNQITNYMLAPFLSHYGELNCLFDPDPGGIHMFRTLRHLMPEQQMKFLYPDDIQKRLKGSNRLLRAQDRVTLLDYTGISLEVDRLIGLMRQTNRTLEQESYL